MKVSFSTKLEQKEARTLKKLSERSRIPQSKLLEEAIHLLEAQHTHNLVTPEFRRVVDQTIKEDLPALRRLAE